MNAASRAINESNLFTGSLHTINVSKKLRVVLALLMLLLISALVVIYIINEYRSDFSQLQQLNQENQQLQLQYGQLLLEQASLATPERIELFASQKLKMKLPEEKEILMLRQYEN